VACGVDAWTTPHEFLRNVMAAFTNDTSKQQSATMGANSGHAVTDNKLVSHSALACPQALRSIRQVELFAKEMSMKRSVEEDLTHLNTVIPYSNRIPKASRSDRPVHAPFSLSFPFVGADVRYLDQSVCYFYPCTPANYGDFCPCTPASHQ
jgi:hypothetical protein